MSETVIKVKKVKKSYRRYKSNWQKIQNLVFRKDTGSKQPVLHGVDFEIQKGEKVCIIGTALSGKTTLMRILAGVVRSYSGTVEVKGKITPILNHKMGFLTVLSGQDNYYQRAKLLGWTKKETIEHEDAVFEFAGLKKEKDVPVKQYKKGRPARLGFAISTELKPDIMIYDESFSFGSKTFSEKAVKRLKKLIEGDETTFVMTVSQRAYAEMLCERGIVLDKGKVVFDGPLKEAFEYFDTNVKGANKKEEESEELEKIENSKESYQDKDFGEPF